MIARALALLLLCGAGCAPPYPPPPMPSYGTAEGEACGRTCQDAFVKCKPACGELLGGATTSRQRKQCLNECDVQIADCYARCE